MVRFIVPELIGLSKNEKWRIDWRLGGSAVAALQVAATILKMIKMT